ncbi:Mitochondrial carrier protein [Mycena venus]|uniref:Mitochondrial carrier protein n=1 Tax=Mycena venus TaxID=2733690 RepID=A0A8H6Y3Q4_9AGAR|nr:Mitochondrial carrier protein [Mycena venus]
MAFGWLHKLHKSDYREEKAYEQVVNAEKPEHKAALSHELIAAAAAYEAAKKYEEHCAANGKPDSHAKAKELMAAFSGAFVDRMVETKGLDTIDKEKAKHDAKKRAEEQSDEVLIVEYQ